MKNFYFSEAASIYSSVTDGTHDSPKPTSDGKKLITSKHIKGRNIDFETAYFISENDFELINKRSKVNQWDVIISMIGEYCGFCFIERNQLIEYAVKNVGLFKTGNELEAKWLYYYLISPIGKLYLSKSKSGSSQPYLTLGGLRNLKILNCNNKLKRKIVDVLSTLDNKIELNNKINAELEAMAKTLYDYWFVQFDFPTPSPLGRAGVGLPYKSSGGKMVYNEILKREIPEGWIPKRLLEFCNKIGDGIHGTPKYTDFSDYNFINGNNLKNGFIEINADTKKVDAEEYQKYFIELNDSTIFLSINGTIGNLAVYTGETVMLGKSAAYINCKEKYRPYCYQFLKLDHVQKQLWNIATGSTIKNLSLDSLKTLLLPSPTVDLIDKYFSLAKPIDQKRENIFKENQELSTLRDWLLPMLMNGQVSVGKAYEEVEEVLSVAAEDGASYETKIKI